MPDLRSRPVRRLVGVLSLLLVFQGPPLLALEEAGSFRLREEPLVALPAVGLPDLAAADAFVTARLAELGEAWEGWTAEAEPRPVAVVAQVEREAAAPEARFPASPPRAPASGLDLEPTPSQLEALRVFREKSTALEAIPLVPGWNLVSLPEAPTSPDPASVFGAIGGAYTRALTYRTCDAADPWKEWNPANPAGSDLTAIDPSQGLWIEATSAVELPSDGTLPASTTFQLCPGWNLIGFPAGQPRSVPNALHAIEGKYLRVFGFDPADPADPWEVYSVGVPAWANDLAAMQPGRGYWLLATEAATLTIANQGPDPVAEILSPSDLGVVKDFTEITARIESPILETWQLTVQPVGDGEPMELASGDAPVAGGVLTTFDPTLLLNGLYELKLTVTDHADRFIEDRVAVVVEGGLKLGNFTLSFVDLAIPLAGLDIEVTRTYDSRDKLERDFGVGWTLDVSAGSYRNNRKPGEGWQLENGFLPCDTTRERRSHVTTIRLSDREVYRFAPVLVDTAATFGGCFARVAYQMVGGPLPGSTLAVVGNDRVFWQEGGLQLVDENTFEVWEAQRVILTTRDGRIYEVDLDEDIVRVADLLGNELQILPEGIIHAPSGERVDFERDAQGRITAMVDPQGRRTEYAYDAAGDLVSVTDRGDNVTTFGYVEDHYLQDIHDARGVRAVRSEYDDDGRLVKVIDAQGNELTLAHDLSGRREVVTNRLGFSRVLEYDGNGNVVRETDEIGKVTTRTFSLRDDLLTETDPLGHTTVNTYNAAGDLLTTTDPLENTWTSTYDDGGRITSQKDPRGGTTTWSYSPNTKVLTETIDPLSNRTWFEFDNRHQPIAEHDPLGGVTRTVWHLKGYGPISVTDAAGATTTYTYDANGNQRTETSTRTLGDGTVETLVTTFEYDELDRLVRTTQPDGAVTETRYDELGAVLETIDPLGRSTTFAYDERGNQVLATYPDGTTEARTYDAENRLKTSTDRGGRTTTYTYDPVGRLIETTLPDGTKTGSVYDAAGRLTSSIDGRGNATTYVYDAAGRRTAVVDALGHATTFAYDAAGNQTGVTDALDHTTTFEYDAAGRLVRTIFADGTDRETGYDALGRRITETDQADITTTFGYDPVGRLVQVTDALGGITRYTWDEQGNRTSQTDANGHTTRFEYDEMGRLSRRILPDGAAESMVYNLAGRMTSYTDFMGRSTSLTHDTSRRLLRKSVAGSIVDFTYTPTGRRATMTDSRGTTSYTYDVRDRQLSETHPDGHVLIYEWDAAGNRASVTAGVAGRELTTNYAYDALNRLASIVDPEGGVYRYEYDAVGNRSYFSRPNGVVTTYSYDSASRLINAATSRLAGATESIAYTLHPTGRTLEALGSGGTRRSYSYDAAYRLTSELQEEFPGTDTFDAHYAHDAVGNRIRVTIAGPGAEDVVLSYDNRNRLTSRGEQLLNWDSNGSLATDDKGTVYGWSSEGRLESATLNDGNVVHYEYDGDGLMTGSEVVGADGQARRSRYLVDRVGPLPHVIVESRETSESDTSIAYYARGSELLAILDPDDPAQSLYTDVDSLGSIRTLTNTNGDVADSYVIAASGELLEHTGQSVNPYLLAGERRDHETGLYFLRARWMDPRFGSFLSMDPHPGQAADPLSLNKYVYANGDPVNRVDPLGLFASVAGAGAAMAVMGSLATTIGARSPVANPVYSYLSRFVTVYVRSFAPWDTFSFVALGDNRGFTTSTADDVTSRISSRVVYDTRRRRIISVRAESSPSHSLFGRFGQSIPTATATETALGFDLDYAGAIGIDDLLPNPHFLLGFNPAPDIDVHLRLGVTRRGFAVCFSGTLTGDQYPSAEVFVESLLGTKMLHTFAAPPALRHLGPAVSLWGDRRASMGRFPVFGAAGVCIP